MQFHSMQKAQNPIQDFVSVVVSWDLWFFLSANDLYSRYRRSFLGPMWVVLGNSIAIFGISVIWSLIFGLDWRANILYIILGYLSWQFISVFIIASAELFSAECSSYIKATAIPVTFFVARFTSRHLFTYLHYLIIIFVACVAVSYTPAISSILLWVMGIFIVTINGFFFSITLGFLGARYRDISYAIASFITPIFMISPILWRPEMLGQYKWFADVNPLTHFIFLMRGFLLGEQITTVTAVFVAVFTLVNIVVSIWTYTKYRKHLTYWV